MLAHSFLIESSSKLLVTRTGIKAGISSVWGLWFPWPIYMFFEMRFDLGTLDLGEWSLPFGYLFIIDVYYKLLYFHVFFILWFRHWKFIRGNFNLRCMMLSLHYHYICKYLVRLLNLRGIKFTNISENNVLVNNSEFTLFHWYCFGKTLFKNWKLILVI